MSMLERLKGILHQTPLEKKIYYTLYELEKVHRSLEKETMKMQSRAESLFQKCVKAREIKDQKTATMYANECAKVREMSVAILQSQLAIEQAMLKLESVRYFRDLITQMEPLRPLIQKITQKLSGVFPSASIVLDKIGASLNEIMIEAGDTFEYSGPVSSPMEDADKILKDATVLAEQKMKATFPNLDRLRSPEETI
jgi:division protein CdvB (Snf7/Vps24/ESCRT-III family)